MSTYQRAYRIVQTSRRVEGRLEALKRAKRPNSIKIGVVVDRWHGWNKSLWVKLLQYGNSVYVDSGVIEDLYFIIKEMKKERR